MVNVTLGRTGITVNRNGFGALPVQRVQLKDAAYLLRKAYDNGINFFDTARAYSDSEEKIGHALSDVRGNIIITTKSHAKKGADLLADLDISLRNLRTDHVDVLQFHNPPFCPKLGGEDGLYDAALKAQKDGKIRFIGITNHRLAVAREALDSGLYDTLQFPFSYLANDDEIALVNLCRDKNVGFICMKALAGGLITRSDAAYAWLAQYPNTLPIWGVQRESELDEFLSYNDNPPVMTDEITALIDKDRQELAGEFCRGCGYCMPCTVGIEINNCNRMSLLLRRAPAKNFLTQEGQEKMMKIEKCVNCGKCVEKCPYSLNVPDLLKRNLADYRTFL